MLNVRIYVYPCEYWSVQRKINIWMDYIHTCDNKHVIIIRFGFVDLNQSKDGFGVGHASLSMFDHYNKIPLAVNISVQRLDINGVLGVLRWAKPLFEFIYSFRM